MRIVAGEITPELESSLLYLTKPPCENDLSMPRFNSASAALSALRSEIAHGSARLIRTSHVECMWSGHGWRSRCFW
jgi:hypothetical protein